MGKVLLIEDVIFCINLLQRLISYGYGEEVVCVVDEDSAFKEISLSAPDFIIVDNYFVKKEGFILDLRSRFSGLIIGKSIEPIDLSKKICDFYIFKPIDADVFPAFLSELKKRIKVLETSELHAWLSEQQIKFQPMDLSGFKVKSTETVDKKKA